MITAKTRTSQPAGIAIKRDAMHERGLGTGDETAGIVPVWRASREVARWPVQPDRAEVAG